MFGADTTPTSAAAGQTFKFSITITDNIGIDRAEVEYWFDTESHQISSLIHEGDDIYSYVITIPADETNFLHYFFTALDTSGNSASTSQKDVTIISASELPAPVELSIKCVTSTSITLEWTQYLGNDFSKYEIYMANFPGFSPSADTLIKTITAQSTVTYTATNLDANITYYFILRVINAKGYFADSNEVFATTLPPGATANEPPASVELTLSEISSTSIKLTWTQNHDEDFAKYEIHKSLLASFRPSELTLVASITDQELTTYTITGLEPSTTYYLLLRVVDTAGLVADSDIVAGTTQAEGEAVNLPPVAYGGGNKTAKVGEAVEFLGTGNDDDGYIIKYEWDFDGDGTFDWVSTTPEPVTFTYGIPGTYQAVLRVTDDNGVSATQMITIQVLEPAAPKPEDEERERLKGDWWERWEPIVTLLTILGTAIAGVLGYIWHRRKRTKLRAYMSRIDDTYNKY
jgi:hypothetical protein